MVTFKTIIVMLKTFILKKTIFFKVNQRSIISIDIIKFSFLKILKSNMNQVEDADIGNFYCNMVNSTIKL